MSGWNTTAWFSILTGAAMKSFAVLAVAWLAAAVLRRHSAAARHLVWTAAFAALLALPFLSAALPALRIPVAGVVLPSTSVVFQETISAERTALHPSTPGSTTTRIHSGTRAPDWRMGLMLLWGAGTLLAFARMLAAYAAAGRLRRAAQPFPDDGLCGKLSQTLGLRRPVRLLRTAAGSMPMACGLRRPAILMPADAVAWPAGRRRIVLLHELAHVRRGESVPHLLAHTVMALYWWNPLAWTAWREFLKERERAADDLVLNAGARASEYAGHLLEVARTMQTPPGLAWAAAAVARRSQLEGRLHAILDGGVDRTAPARATVWASVLLAAAILLPLAAVRAQDSPAQTVPADVDTAIRVARSQKNYETLDAAAQAATQTGQYDAARKLLEAALAIRAETAGGQSVEYGVGLVKLAELEQKSNPHSGGELYTRAAQILGEQPEAARALTHLGVAALAKKDFVHAFEYFQHAQLVDPRHAGMALMWMAVARQREGNVDEAERLYQSALAAPDPAGTPVILRVYGQFLRARDREDQASQMESRAAALQKADAGPAPAMPAGVYRVGHGVGAPKLDQRQEPQYTDEARLASLQGTVVVQVVVGIDGLPHDARIVRGLGLGLDENAVETISQWRFKPGLKDGQPVPIAATIEVNFKLL